MINQCVVLTKISNVVTEITGLVTDVNHAGKSITLDVNDAIYIGSPLPFNALYMRLGASVNNNPSALSVAFWDATTFVDFYKVNDGTSAVNSTLGKSGVLNLTAIDNKNPCAFDSKRIAEIGVDGFYNLYWTRLKTSAILDAVLLMYIGQLFLESDTAIYTEYPDLNSASYLKVFGGVTKTDWLDQRIIATDRVITDLIIKNQIISGEQFLDWRLMKEPALHKTAELIYKGLGIRYKEDCLAANKSYIQSLEARKYGFGSGNNVVKTQAKIYERQPMGFYR